MAWGAWEFWWATLTTHLALWHNSRYGCDMDGENAQAIATEFFDHEVVPTCKSATEADKIWLSPEAIHLLRWIRVTNDSIDHCTVAVDLCPTVVYRWPRPSRTQSLNCVYGQTHFPQCRQRNSSNNMGEHPLTLRTTTFGIRCLLLFKIGWASALFCAGFLHISILHLPRTNLRIGSFIGMGLLINMQFTPINIDLLISCNFFRSCVSRSNTGACDWGSLGDSTFWFVNMSGPIQVTKPTLLKLFLQKTKNGSCLLGKITCQWTGRSNANMDMFRYQGRFWPPLSRGFVQLERWEFWAMLN